MIDGIRFANPGFLWLLMALPAIVVFRFIYLRKKETPLR
ncbi:MAG: BatA domain-containing protein, partial [Bacteroidota bacterium]